MNLAPDSGAFPRAFSLSALRKAEFDRAVIRPNK